MMRSRRRGTFLILGLSLLALVGSAAAKVNCNGGSLVEHPEAGEICTLGGDDCILCTGEIVVVVG